MKRYDLCNGIDEIVTLKFVVFTYKNSDVLIVILLSHLVYTCVIIPVPPKTLLECYIRGEQVSAMMEGSAFFVKLHILVIVLLIFAHKELGARATCFLILDRFLSLYGTITMSPR